MILSQPVSFHYPVDLLGDDPLASCASEIVQRASNHHHLVHHSLATVTKLVSQNPQTLHRCQRMLYLDAIGRQQTVELAMSPMQSSSLASLPRRHYACCSSCQSFKATVTQKRDLLRKRQPRSLSHFLIMAPDRHRGRTPQHSAL